MSEDDCKKESKMTSWLYEKIERKVVALYVEQGICSLPIDPFAIIKKRGYILVAYNKVNHPTQKDGDDVFSWYDPQRKTYVIAYNPNRQLDRVRFTLMHEIGHIDMGHKCESGLAKKIADYYAGYALAPSPLIQKFANADVETIRKVFNVSLQCAQVRSDRYMNWLLYGDRAHKDYEDILLNLVK